MSRALFVSDIHISSSEDPKHALFLRVLQACRERRVSQLFLVGDIFDLWIADRDYFVARYAEVVRAMRELVAAGVQVHYFEGNHDLDLHAFWERQLGVHVYSSPQIFVINGLGVRVEHGDQMDPGDRGYLFLRWLLRTRAMVTAGRWLPNRAVRMIGERASVASRDYTTGRAVDDGLVREKVRLHARRVYREQPFDLFISGHVHVSEDSMQNVGGETSFRCVNLGTWLKEPLVLELDGREIRLQNVRQFISAT